eukprot:4650276-Prymnesium_polylepis.1
MELLSGTAKADNPKNPPFDQWDLAVLRATYETRAVQLVTACARWQCIPITPKPTHYPTRHPLHVCEQLDGLPVIINTNDTRNAIGAIRQRGDPSGPREAFTAVSSSFGRLFGPK